MRKKIIYNFCDTCGHQESSEESFCDTCGKQLSYSTQIHYQIGYYNIIYLKINHTDYDFCDLKCLWKFITNEIHKENPRTDIEFGKEN